ncbi:MAG: hypothetical protein IJ709_03045 [Selenomonas sp.]|nr:hypothetical protein [Selenomonas sp.]
MEEKKIRAIPQSGTWKDLYERILSMGGKAVWIKLQITPGLLDDVGYYDGVRMAKEKGCLEIPARAGKDGLVYLQLCVQQNYGDEDGFGVEPDDWMYGVIDADGVFVEPLYVR